MGSVISKLLEEEREYRLPRPIENFNMESVIKWQTGEPKESGSYLVTLRFGFIEEDSWSNIIQRWSRNNGEVIAWCKLSSIKPYKEETK